MEQIEDQENADEDEEEHVMLNSAKIRHQDNCHVLQTATMQNPIYGYTA